MEKQHRVAQIYGYTVCLVAVITLIICVANIIPAIMDLSDPLHSGSAAYQRMWRTNGLCDLGRIRPVSWKCKPTTMRSTVRAKRRSWSGLGSSAPQSGNSAASRLRAPSGDSAAGGRNLRRLSDRAIACCNDLVSGGYELSVLEIPSTSRM